MEKLRKNFPNKKSTSFLSSLNVKLNLSFLKVATALTRRGSRALFVCVRDTLKIVTKQFRGQFRHDGKIKKNPNKLKQTTLQPGTTSWQLNAKISKFTL